MNAVFCLLPVMGYAMMWHLTFKQTVSVSVFLSISAVSVLMYFAGMTGILKFGGYAVFYGGILLLLLSAVKYPKKFLSFVTSVPVVIYFFAAVCFSYLMRDANLFYWDEFSHWGLLVKEMYFFNSLYDSTSNAQFFNYPPGLVLWGYFAVLNTGFSESGIYIADFLLLFSSTLMMYERLAWKQVHWILLIFGIQMVVFADFGHWFSSIYADHILGGILVGLILGYFSQRYSPYRLLVFAMPLILLVLTKKIGWAFGFIFLGLILTVLLTRIRFRPIKLRHIKHHIAALSILGVIMMMVLGSWQFRLNQTTGGIKDQRTVVSSVSALFDQTKLSDETKQNVRGRFLEITYRQQLHKEKLSQSLNEFTYDLLPLFKKTIKLTALGCFVFILALYALSIWLVKNRRKRFQIAVSSGFLLLTGVLYWLFLYILYPVSLGENIPSYVRYMNIIILPVMMTAFVWLTPISPGINPAGNKSLLKYYFISCTVALIVLVGITRPYFVPMYSQPENPFKKSAQPHTQKVVDQIPPKSTLFVVFSAKNNGMLNVILKYLLIPLKSTVNKNEFSENSTEKMLEIYTRYDYVWFANLNRELAEKNARFLKRNSEGKLSTLYRVKKEINGTDLIPIF